MFAFDNIKCHQKYAVDVLHTGNINLTLGGKNVVPIRDGLLVKPDRPYEIPRLSIILPNGWLKGLRIVPQETGFWPTGREFLAQCSIPGNCPGTTKLKSTCKYASNVSSYSCALLSAQPDFQAQEGELQETIEAARHMKLKLSKY